MIPTHGSQGWGLIIPNNSQQLPTIFNYIQQFSKFSTIFNNFQLSLTISTILNNNLQVVTEANT